MELKDLVGGHVLDAVDMYNEQVKKWGDSFEDCEVMRFRLDGIVYTALEDPSDGYRSCMEDLSIEDQSEMKNVFPPIDVVAIYRDKGDWSEKDDVLELIDVKTGKTVVSVGTCNFYEYYPSFVANFNPEAMITNA